MTVENKDRNNRAGRRGPLFMPQKIVKEGTLPFVFDKSRKSRFGLMPRDGKHESAIKCGGRKHDC